MNTDLLHKYFVGETSLEEVAEIKKWTEASSENMQQFMHERKMFDVLMLQDKHWIERTMVPRRTFWNSIFLTLRRSVSVAALVVCVFLLSVFLSDYFRPIPQQIISVPAGQRIDLELADGSKVCLNGRSSLTYPVSFSRKERQVKLNGQAFFEVAADEKHPFVVSTDKARIVVVGTKFDVIDFENDNHFETTLMKGQVRVALNSELDNEYTITPNMKVYLKDGELVREYVEDQYPYLWKEGLIGFRNATFEEIMNNLQKNFDVTILVDHPENLNVSYTGKFRIADGVDYALKVLQNDVSFTFKRSENHKVIYINAH